MRRILPSFLSACVSAQSIFNLSDVTWTVSNGANVTIPGKLPSQSYLDLYAAGVIDDPLYGFNDVNQDWVQKSNWTWKSGPIAGLDRTNGSQTWLVFEGLDTFAEIKMCNTTIANVANQFRQFTFDVTAILTKCCGDATLSLNFGSASIIGSELAKTGPDYIKYANGAFNPVAFQGKEYVRKEQNDFGWDWSPFLAPAGPWRPAYVVQKTASDPVYIHNALIDIYREGQMNNLSPDQLKPWVFNASIDFLGTLPSDAKMQLQLQDSSGNVMKEVALDNVTHNQMTVTGSTIIDEPVALWWPSRIGEQYLYNATITIESSKWREAATVNKRVGFRTIVLNLNPITDEQLASGVAPGANWHFEVNGHEFYAKGSNFVPPDVFWPRVNRTKVRELFELAIEAKQNMLRVWASGAYLADEIYDLADEMGILLWSEFEFSDALYPVSPEYLAEYEAEAYYNVRRVNHHPSLALWAGGNELEEIVLGLSTYFDPGPIISGYEKVFTELLIKCVYANTRSISYIPSSTYHGYLNLDFDSVQPQTPRYLNQSSPDDIYANTDYYNYDASQAFDLSKIPVGRFATEFGFLSMPSVQSWRDAIPEDQFSIDSPEVVHHNRHTPFGASGGLDVLSRLGIADMTRAVELWYPIPALSDPVANFNAWNFATQVFQADKYANDIAYYRRGSGLRERQLGALYWQLNDVWVAPTWSAVEASGRPKPMYHTTKDVFSPVIIWPFYNQDTDVLEVWIVSDKWDAVAGEATLRWLNWEGENLGSPASVTKAFNVGAINATHVATYQKVSSTFANEAAAANALLFLSLTTDQGDTHSSWFHVLSLGKAALRDPGLEVEAQKDGAEGYVSFKVTATDAVAAWVWLEYPSSVRGYFDQNAFWLSKGESRVVQFRIWDDFTDDKSWVKEVTVRSIWDLTVTR
ncbi:glycoside hydrolase family 2 protein [Xylariaceae sp. FL1651]|nr:glycoside hydrolase family 2 protein [Xylariaceae sp. FL1651]